MGSLKNFEDFYPRDIEFCHLAAARRVKLWPLNANLFFEEPHLMAYFTYCSAIWNNCNESDKQKLERLNVRALRCVYNKRVPLHGDDDYGLTLSNRRLQDIAILIFKAVNGMLPGYISDLFVVRKNVKCLRGTNKLVVPRKKT